MGFDATRAVLLLILLAVPSTAEAIWPFSSSKRSPSETAAPEAGSTSITAPEVARRAEEANRAVRDIEALLVPGPGVLSIQHRLPDIGTRLGAQTEATTRQLDDNPSGATLDALTSQWKALGAELTTYVNVLAERATTLERSLESLKGLQETWTQTRSDVGASKAPAQVVDRIDGILAAISRTRSRTQLERAATLVLQDRVAQHGAQCDEMLARLGTVRTDMAGRVLARDGVPLWNTERLSEAATELPRRVRRAVDSAVADLRRFAPERRERIAFTIALFAGLVPLMIWASRTARTLGPDARARARPVLERPVASALLLTLVASAFSGPRAHIAHVLGGMIVLVPALMVAGVGLDPARVRALSGLGALLLLDHLRRLASTVPLLEQQIFLLEMLAAIGMLGWSLHARRAHTTGGMRLAVAGGLVAFAASAVAAAGGYVSLALFVGSGIVGSTFVALMLYGAVKVIASLIAVALAVRPLRELRVVRYHRPLLERRLGGVLRGLAVVAWAVLALRHFGLWAPAVSLMQASLEAELHRGSLKISLGSILVFVVTVVATFMLSALVRFGLQEEIYPRVAPERVLPYAISTLVHYTLVAAGFLLGLAVLGVDLTKITIVAGALGVGIGFGLQGLVNNFVSGLVILSERRINVGDAVQIGDVGGQVQQLGIRACTVRTWEGAEVIVPNASLVNEKVANWTLSDRRRRIDWAVSVAYGTPPEKVTDVLLGVARAHVYVLSEPAPMVLFQGVGDSALRFELRVWTDRFESWAVTRSELAVAGYAALRDAAIEIPVPQHEIRVRQG